MTQPFHQPYRRDDGTWRISRTENGVTVDLCGAINEVVALEQSIILNRMHGRKS